MRKIFLPKHYVLILYFMLRALIIWLALFGLWKNHGHERLVTSENIRNLKNGQLVQIETDHVLHMKDEHDASKTGILINGKFAVICVGKTAYVLVELKNSDVIQALESYEEGNGEAVRLVAEVCHEKVPITKLDEKIVQDYDQSKMIESFYLKEYDEDMDYQPQLFAYFVAAIIASVVALVAFFANGGIHTFYESPFEDSERYKRYVKGEIPDLERELEHEKNILRMLESEKKTSWKYLVSGILFNAAGQFIPYLPFYEIVPLPLWLLTLFLRGFGVSLVVEFLWNIDSDRIYRLSERFAQETYSVKKVRAQKCIAVLEERIRKEEQQNETFQIPHYNTREP